MGVFQKLVGVEFPNNLPLLTKDPMVTIGTIALIDFLRTACKDPVPGVVVADQLFNNLALTSAEGNPIASTGNIQFKVDTAVPSIEDRNGGIYTSSNGKSAVRFYGMSGKLDNKSWIFLMHIKHDATSSNGSYAGRCGTLLNSGGSFQIDKTSTGVTFYVYGQDGVRRTLSSQVLTGDVIYQLGISYELVGDGTTRARAFVNGQSVGSLIIAGEGSFTYNAVDPVIMHAGSTFSVDVGTRGTYFRALFEDLTISERAATDVALEDYQVNLGRFS